MNKKTISNILIALFVTFFAVLLFLAGFFIPAAGFIGSADIGYLLMEDILFVILAEILLALAMISVVLMIALVNLYKQEKEYSRTFVNRLSALTGVGLAGTFFIIVGTLFLTLSGFTNGYLLMYSSIILGIVVAILIVIQIVRSIVLDTIEYKTENELFI